MDAGLLAIAGGAGALGIESPRKSTEELGATKEQKPFRNYMEQSKSSQWEKKAANDSVAPTEQKSAEVELAADTESEVTVEGPLTEEQWQEAAQVEGGLLLVSQAALDTDGIAALIEKIAAGLGAGEAGAAAWHLTVTQAGTPILMVPEGSDIAAITEQLQMQGFTVFAVSADTQLQLPEGQLSDEALLALEEWLEQLRLMQAALQSDGQEVAVVAAPFAQVAQNSLLGGASGAREVSVTIEAVDDAAGGAEKIAALGGSLSLDDLALTDEGIVLDDGDTAKLDALIERIGQQADKRLFAAPQDFKSLMDEAIADTKLSGSVKGLEAAQAATQTSQTVQQTTLESASPARFVHAAHLFDARNSSPSEQVRVSIGQTVKGDLDRLQIQLDPADLGRVEIRVDRGHDGRVGIIVQAENRDTLDLLQRDAKMLQKALQDAGMDAGTQDMQFNLSQGKSGQNENGTEDARVSAYGQVDAVEQEQAALQDVALSSYTLSIAQGLDIKV